MVRGRRAAEVEEGVDVERGDAGVLAGLEQVLDRQAAGPAGVHETGQPVDEHRSPSSGRPGSSR